MSTGLAGSRVIEPPSSSAADLAVAVDGISGYFLPHETSST
jgi:hypothetical protein